MCDINLLDDNLINVIWLNSFSWSFLFISFSISFILLIHDILPVSI